MTTVSAGPIFKHKRVTVYPGKHGKGDYRVEFAGKAPTHDEILVLLYWVFKAEDRYAKYGRDMLWWLIKEAVYQNGMSLEDIITNGGGSSTRSEV